MKNWKTVLKEAGQTDQQIADIEKTLGTSGALFDTLIANADAANTEAAAKLAQVTEKTTKLNNWWENDATKQINEAFGKATTAQAEAAYYRTQAEKAKEAGFLPKDAPGYVAPKAGEPEAGFKPGQNPVPGSPQYMTADQVIGMQATSMYIMGEHQRLFGTPLPGDEVIALLNEAGTTKQKAVDVWRSKYKVTEKIAELSAADQKKHDDAIRTEEREKTTRAFHEQYGNPETRPMQASRFPKYAQQGATGGPDRLAWSRTGAKEAFKQKIHEQVAKETGSIQ